ncbi:hypothetical protein [Mycoplasma sp. SG1]|uniref:hypothetical protein n=1 Tax=Mycoplasma sp. SG1 TaxID=2810348 RepID=UPI002024AC0F|nr:hypothetical protein [Mycoplasma sp. SG1]URM52767.1 hypothetical protein JRW51_00255 [Mycoplasma sp. SG1]
MDFKNFRKNIIIKILLFIIFIGVFVGGLLFKLYFWNNSSSDNNNNDVAFSAEEKKFFDPKYWYKDQSLSSTLVKNLIIDQNNELLINKDSYKQLVNNFFENKLKKWGYNFELNFKYKSVNDKEIKTLIKLTFLKDYDKHNVKKDVNLFYNFKLK